MKAAALLVSDADVDRKAAEFILRFCDEQWQLKQGGSV
jgi:hypothetical protein